MTSVADYGKPAPQFAFDLNTSPFFVKDANNYINVMGVAQLNTLQNISILDIFLSANHVIEPHYHPNAAELVYCVSGMATVSILNPFTKQLLNFTITPGQVVNVPQGWWHYEIANADHTHLIAIFDAPTPEVILGSDLLTMTPSSVIAHTYCINEHKWNDVISNVQPSTIIGPACRRPVAGLYPNAYANGQLF
jgi:quercetin dioxygenase-like cupin family protein